jgi:hypothetical protein
MKLRATSATWKSNRDAGASPLFPPQHETSEQAKAAILDVIRRDPRKFGIEATRWTLDSIRQACESIASISQGGLSQLLDRLGISWGRSRYHIHSPDPNYEAKLDCIIGLTDEVRSSDGQLALVYLDEVTVYRQPTLANAWEQHGLQALAERSYQSDTKTRVVATLDLVSGRVINRRRHKIGILDLVGFYKDELCSAYDGVERIYVVLDNWPVHFHPDVLVALEHQEQLGRWPGHHPGNWPDKPSREAKRKWGDLELPIQLIRLPTYAPWLNPIEKLWRKLKQELLHLHRLADNLEELRALVDDFLDQFADGSLDLLHYVGLPITQG